MRRCYHRHLDDAIVPALHRAQSPSHGEPVDQSVVSHRRRLSPARLTTSSPADETCAIRGAFVLVVSRRWGQPGPGPKGLQMTSSSMCLASTCHGSQRGFRVKAVSLLRLSG